MNKIEGKYSFILFLNKIKIQKQNVLYQKSIEVECMFSIYKFFHF